MPSFFYYLSMYILAVVYTHALFLRLHCDDFSFPSLTFLFSLDLGGCLIILISLCFSMYKELHKLHDSPYINKDLALFPRITPHSSP